MELNENQLFLCPQRERKKEGERDVKGAKPKCCFGCWEKKGGGVNMQTS
jgi:hypothetical protein